MVFFDDLETRSGDERAAELADILPSQIARAKALGGYKTTLADITARAWGIYHQKCNRVWAYFPIPRPDL
jgi:hypothetical protein